MTAQEYQELAADLSHETAAYRHLTESTTNAGRVFDYAAPLPNQPTYRPREWEQEGAR